MVYHSGEVDDLEALMDESGESTEVDHNEEGFSQGS